MVGLVVVCTIGFLAIVVGAQRTYALEPQRTVPRRTAIQRLVERADLPVALEVDGAGTASGTRGALSVCISRPLDSSPHLMPRWQIEVRALGLPELEIRREGPLDAWRDGPDASTEDDRFDRMVRLNGPEPVIRAVLDGTTRATVRWLVLRGGSLSYRTLRMQVEGEDGVAEALPAMLTLADRLRESAQQGDLAIARNAASESNPLVRAACAEHLAARIQLAPRVVEALLRAADDAPARMDRAQLQIAAGQIDGLKSCSADKDVPSNLRCRAVDVAHRRLSDPVGVAAVVRASLSAPQSDVAVAAAKATEALEDETWDDLVVDATTNLLTAAAITPPRDLRDAVATLFKQPARRVRRWVDHAVVHPLDDIGRPALRWLTRNPDPRHGSVLHNAMATGSRHRAAQAHQALLALRAHVGPQTSGGLTVATVDPAAGSLSMAHAPDRGHLTDVEALRTPE